MNKYQVGDFGYFDFSIKKKDKYGKYVITPFQLYATIKVVEEKNIEIKDNDGYPYIITKTKIKEFRKEVRNVT